MDKSSKIVDNLPAGRQDLGFNSGYASGFDDQIDLTIKNLLRDFGLIIKKQETSNK